MQNLSKTLSTWSANLAIRSVLVYRVAKVLADAVCVSVFGVALKCKHTPSCSEYAIRSIKTHGTIRGSIKGCIRLLSCW